jgi:3-hydroxyisobutyrate dehydrogenase-like beta-hydroxyacid dehydrogenase
MMSTPLFMGFGEAGMAFAIEGARAFDAKTDDPGEREAKLGDYRMAGVVGCASLTEALNGADLILSIVTADQALAVAREAAQHIAQGAMWIDMNSVSPETKRSAARLIEDAGAHYVDVAIMAPVHPKRRDVALLASGAHADECVGRLRQLGFSDVRSVGEDVGRASAIKMIRSVMVKGIEALTAECFLAAEIAGVTGEVIQSLDASASDRGWASRADYNLDRMMVHGLRRAAEMEEVAMTLDDLGVEPWVTRDVARRQRAIGELGLSPPPQGLQAKLHAIAGQAENHPA